MVATQVTLQTAINAKSNNHYLFTSFPVDFSCAETLRMLFTSKSNVTSICGTPLGAGGMPSNTNVPNKLLSSVISRSPS